MADKKKIELEFPVNVSAKVLYNRISTPAGLAEWFADDVNVDKKIYNFQWDGSEQSAQLLSKKDMKHVRFSWLDEDDSDIYFEFTINVDELTGDVALLITDFVDEGEEEDAADLWESQVSELKHGLGS